MDESESHHDTDVLNDMLEAYQSYVTDGGKGRVKALQKLKNEYNNRHIASGYARDVYELDDNHVVKFGNQQNRTEVETWRCSDEETRSLLCPIVDYDGQNYIWIVMKRANVPELEYRRLRLATILIEKTGGKVEYIRDYDSSKEVYMSSNYGEISDIHTANVAELNGKAVLIDYGR